MRLATHDDKRYRGARGRSSGTNARAGGAGSCKAPAWSSPHLSPQSSVHARRSSCVPGFGETAHIAAEAGNALVQKDEHYTHMSAGLSCQFLQIGQKYCAPRHVQGPDSLLHQALRATWLFHRRSWLSLELQSLLSHEVANRLALA